MTLTAAHPPHAAVPIPPPPRADGHAGDDAPPAPGPSPQPAAGPPAPADEPAGGRSPATAPPHAVWRELQATATSGGVATGALADGAAVSALDLDLSALEPTAYTRPQSPRPPRPRPIQAPSSIDESVLRRQRVWVAGVTAGFGAVSAAVLASWFL